MKATVRHPAGAATYPGDVRSILGDVMGPTTYGSYVLAAAAQYDESANYTRVQFVHIPLSEDGSITLTADEVALRQATALAEAAL